MCGIVGYVGDRNAAEIIVDGLKRLEYRGYDSAGVAVVDGDRIALRRSVGKIGNLSSRLGAQPAVGTTGLGHTRWATHGRPSEANAHPHADCTGSLVVVHNGIIENYLSLKERLLEQGHKFRSETDTEVIAHLVESYVANGLSLAAAARAALREVRGAYAVGILAADAPTAAHRGQARRGRGGRRPRRGRGPRGLRHPRPATAHPRRGAPGRRGDGGGDALGRQPDHPRGPSARACLHAHHLGRGDGREGRLPALHAEGDLRAAPRGDRDLPGSACRSRAAT